jgi:hypothetical protein
MKKDYEEGQHRKNEVFGPYKVKEKASFEERWVYVIISGHGLTCRILNMYTSGTNRAFKAIDSM